MRGTSPIRMRGPRSALHSAAVVLALGLAVALSSDPGVAAQNGPAEPGGQAPGRVVGRVVSTQTGEPVPGVQVHIPSLDVGTVSGVDGRFALPRLPAGTYDLVVESLGYGRKTVSGVAVAAGGTTVQDIALEPQAIAIGEITVEAAIERGATTALMTERRLAATVTDAIGSEQISRSPDGTAAAALQRVPGVTVVDDRYVYVRGLGERYGATTLNGAPLPSPEPDKKVVPLDLVPSGLLESVVTAKTYSPDRPGDYAGGLVDIRTRAFPAARTFKLSAGAGFDTGTSLADGLGYAGGDLDFFGVDDGTRDLPNRVPADRPVTSSTFSPADLEAIGESFATGDWGPTSRDLPLNSSFGLSLGDEVDLPDGRSLGFLLSGSHSLAYSRIDGAIERVFGSALLAEPEVDFLGRTTTRSTSSGFLLNSSLVLGPAHKVTLASMVARSTDDEARVLEGYFLDSNANLRSTRLRYLARSLFNAQLGGEHLLGEVRLRWRGSVSRAARDEPNTREVLYRESDGRFLFETFIQSGSVFHQELVEDGLGAGVDLELPFEVRSLPASLGVGASADLRTRDVYARRFRFLPQAPLGEEVRELEPNALFSPENIGPGGFLPQEATFPGDNYDAGHDVIAAYLKLDGQVLPRLRLMGGARVERTVMDVDPVDPIGVEAAPLPPASLEATDVLPALNLTYSLSPDVNLRIAASQTIARPQLRELAPFSFANYAGGYLVIGNPGLERSRIRNYDLRWERFDPAGGVIGVSAFYKRFDAPIETLVVPASEFIQTWVNAEAGTVYGAELEYRSPIGLLGGPLETLSIHLNLTLGESRVELADSALLVRGGVSSHVGVETRERALQGQSPYVINAGLSWFSEAAGTRATLLFNRVGRRIDAVGARGLPDVYEEARNQLDVAVEQPLPWNTELKLSATRLLGDAVEFTQGGDVLRSWNNGRTLSLGVSWQPAGR